MEWTWKEVLALVATAIAALGGGIAAWVRRPRRNGPTRMERDVSEMRAELGRHLTETTAGYERLKVLEVRLEISARDTQEDLSQLRTVLADEHERLSKHLADYSFTLQRMAIMETMLDVRKATKGTRS